ncbi:MAG: FixH family protein [Rhodomicrobium sp.]
MTNTYFRAAAAAIALTASAAAPALAGADDYDVQAVSGEIKAGKGKAIAFKLIDKRTRKPVQGAVFTRTQLDMSPENMADVKGKLAPDTSTDPAVYRFKGDLTMSGVWALKLQAKVPGESATVHGVLILRAND